MNFQEQLADLMRVHVDPQLFAVCHNRVLTGPFAGMEIGYDENWNDGNHALKILGIYEEELHEAIIYSIIRYPQTIINVGCSAGYYAIGMARRLPEAKVYGFDIDPRHFNECLRLATVNGVRERLEVKQGCKFASELVMPDSKGFQLYILDCEGDEIELLQKDLCPALCKADIIVECHDFIREDFIISDNLFNAFKDTHEIEKIPQKIPDLTRFSLFKDETTIVRTLVLTEKRPIDMCWLVMRAKNSPVSF